MDQKSTIGSLSKLQFLKMVRDLVVVKLERNILTPEKSDEILNYLQASLEELISPETLADFLEHLVKKFPELEELKNIWNRAKQEKIDAFLLCILEEFLDRGDMDNALMFLSRFQKESLALLLQEIEVQFPKEFICACQKFENKK